MAKIKYFPICTQIFQIKEIGALGLGAPPPPIIFERQNLPQQIIHYWKGNLTENKISFKYHKYYFDIFRHFMSHFRDFGQI